MVLELAQLKSKLPTIAVKLTAGVTTPKEARRILEELYGGREVAIISAMHKLEESGNRTRS